MAGILERRKQMVPLGVHTALGILQQTGKWKDIPYLKENEGLLPPFIIAVGDRRRVLMAPEVLNLKNPVFIDDEARKIGGILSMGRVSILIGTHIADNIEFPLAVVETQMGCSATQINIREILYFSQSQEYSFDGRTISADGTYLIRAGTCAGVNSHKKSELSISIGDILIATKSYGSIGAVIQSSLGMISYCNKLVTEQVEREQRVLTLNRIAGVSYDGEHISTSAADRIILRLQQAADTYKVRKFTGPNFSKDSLYAELGEDGFAQLRDKYGVISTEMEEVILDVLAAEFSAKGIPVYNGLISAAVGAIPGKSFPETEQDKKDSYEAEQNIMKIAAGALRNIATGLNRGISMRLNDG